MGFKISVGNSLKKIMFNTISKKQLKTPIRVRNERKSNRILVAETHRDGAYYF